MDRFNSEGVARSELLWYLGNARHVRTFRRLNRCMLCRRAGVNEAALCDACWAILSDAEFELASQWVTGERV